MTTHGGPHFLQIPGPTNVPERVLRALARPTMDHRGPEFGELGRKLLAALQPIFGTKGAVIMYPASGTGAWEAALVNTLSPGDTVLCFETGWFSTLWTEMATRLGLKPQLVAGDWRHGVDPNVVTEKLKTDTARAIKAVMIVHNETSTGVTSRVPEVRKAIDAAGHPALLFVDTISSLASMPYQHDAWGVDVTVAGSQKGLMLPPGLSFNAVSAKAIEASKSAKLTKSYWAWDAMLAVNKDGYFPFTPATNLLYGAVEACAMLMEEGMERVFARHHRLAEATRRCVRGWGLETQAVDPAEYSNSLTAVRVPDGSDADKLRAVILERYNMSLGNGLGRLKGKVFRIGHLGHFSEPMLMGTLSTIELGLSAAGVPHKPQGVAAALDYLKSTNQP
jgi:alanine-glyoxylate transaminase / serine-glyoxylate transaminase / serine-pyruvate transaminase